MKRPEYRVLTYDGFKGNERPRSIAVGGKSLRVEVVEESWISTGVDPESEVCRGFVVRCEKGARFRAIYSDGSGWQVNRLPDAVKRASHLKRVE